MSRYIYTKEGKLKLRTLSKVLMEHSFKFRHQCVIVDKNSLNENIQVSNRFIKLRKLYPTKFTSYPQNQPFFLNRRNEYKLKITKKYNISMISYQKIVFKSKILCEPGEMLLPQSMAAFAIFHSLPLFENNVFLRSKYF